MGAGNLRQSADDASGIGRVGEPGLFVSYANGIARTTHLAGESILDILAQLRRVDPESHSCLAGHRLRQEVFTWHRANQAGLIAPSYWPSG